MQQKILKHTNYSEPSILKCRGPQGGCDEVESIKKREEVSVQVQECGLLGFGRQVGQPKPSVFGRNRSVPGSGDGDHLMPPRVPGFRESVEEHHRRRRLATDLRHVELQAVDWYVLVLYLLHFQLSR
ncbi:clathrin [Striga asiatica]|uniref:Clathrin n=1 Tax=Striga asiatica TaxID=4170 RepID=A0A5A7NY48_STRAF|nr:clathrin [Striga asiatica]